MWLVDYLDDIVDGLTFGNNLINATNIFARIVYWIFKILCFPLVAIIMLIIVCIILSGSKNNSYFDPLEEISSSGTVKSEPEDVFLITYKYRKIILE